MFSFFLNFIQRIISEARSYGETLVHPQTKTLIQSEQHYRSHNTNIYDKPLSTIMMDEVDTMAERDLGSTFLLPHTHLYKPDRVSEQKKNDFISSCFQIFIHIQLINYLLLIWFQASDISGFDSL